MLRAHLTPPGLFQVPGLQVVRMASRSVLKVRAQILISQKTYVIPGPEFLFLMQGKRKGSPDISSALVGKRQRLSPTLDEHKDISEFLQSSILKRDIKGGTKLIKNAKGKAKLAKGEVGGGSFQSMGQLPYLVQYTSYR